MNVERRRQAGIASFLNNLAFSRVVLIVISAVCEQAEGGSVEVQAGSGHAYTKTMKEYYRAGT